MSKKEKEDFSEYPGWKQMIIKWNDVCDIMGSRQALWVLRIECEFKGCLTEMNPQVFRMKILPALRKRYAELVRCGKIKGE